MGRLLIAQEEERRRVAYEVYDELAQLAAGTYQHLQAFADEHRPRALQAREELNYTLELAQRTVREPRRVVANLRPTVLDDFGLAAAVRQLAGEYQAEGWDVSYQEDLGTERLPSTIETALFRVAQEALRNVQKHAQTNRVQVALERQEQIIRLEVRDWGRGFEVAAVQPGSGAGERVGLAGMQERMALLGGCFRVEGQPGVGTRVIVEVRVSHDAGCTQPGAW